jgi:hypothetical protein
MRAMEYAANMILLLALIGPSLRVIAVEFLSMPTSLNKPIDVWCGTILLNLLSEVSM